MNNHDWLTALNYWLPRARKEQQPEQYQAALMVGSILVTMPLDLATKLRGLSAAQMRNYSDIYLQHCLKARAYQEQPA